MKKYVAKLCRTQCCFAEVEVAAEDIGSARVLAEALLVDPDRLEWKSVMPDVELLTVERAKEPR